MSIDLYRIDYMIADAFREAEMRQGCTDQLTHAVPLRVAIAKMFETHYEDQLMMAYEDGFADGEFLKKQEEKK